MVVAVTGTIVVLAALAGLGQQAMAGNRMVSTQTDATSMRNAALEDAFYHCLDVQAHSLVSPGQPVTIDTRSFANFVTLLQGVGSWVTIAEPPSTTVARLSLRNDTSGPGACLGTVVVAHYTQPRRGIVVRIGSGATVPGHGPPPPTPL